MARWLVQWTESASGEPTWQCPLLFLSFLFLSHLSFVAASVRSPFSSISTSHIGLVDDHHAAATGGSPSPSEPPLKSLLLVSLIFVGVFVKDVSFNSLVSMRMKKKRTTRKQPKEHSLIPNYNPKILNCSRQCCCSCVTLFICYGELARGLPFDIMLMHQVSENVFSELTQVRVTREISAHFTRRRFGSREKVSRKLCPARQPKPPQVNFRVDKAVENSQQISGT